MKKREYIEYINALKLLKYYNNKNIDLDIEKECNELEDNLDLKNRIEQIKVRVNENKLIIKNFKCNCNHDIRLEYRGILGYIYTCVFCGEEIYGDNCCNFNLSDNRNKQFVSLPDDYYNKEKVFEIVMNILNDKEDEEEINFLEEFEKLKLKFCTIYNKRKVDEKYILIIGGTNTIFIDKNYYLKKNSNSISKDFTEYFLALLNTKVELIDNKEEIIIQEDLQNNYHYKYLSYRTIEELEEKLKSQINIPFKLIIDVSQLFNYRIEENRMILEEYNIDLKSLFPNSNIIKVKCVSEKKIEEIKNLLIENNDLIVYENGKYYSYEDNNIISMNQKETCKKIKKMLKRY